MPPTVCVFLPRVMCKRCLHVRAQVYGGDVSDVGRDFVIEYAETNWEMTNVTLPENLSYHHVTPYPANFVKCS